MNQLPPEIDTADAESPDDGSHECETARWLNRRASAARAAWKLPPGVTAGTDDYTHSDLIAEDYDNYFSYAKLFQLDQRILAEHLRVGPGSVIADLGCGTGRALIPLVERGATGWAIDLSEKMLQVVQRKADAGDLAIHLLRANLVQLDCVASESVDGAMCLFSTLGMIHGNEHRQRAIGHLARILKPGGRFVIHVHNFWNQVTDPGGWWYVTKNLVLSGLSRHVERGDRYYPYRGLPKMYLHTFTRRELTRLLRHAGLETTTWHLLCATQEATIRAPWWMGWLRASGWIVTGVRA